MLNKSKSTIKVCVHTLIARSKISRVSIKKCLQEISRQKNKNSEVHTYVGNAIEKILRFGFTNF
jgi:hypothetical protein